MEPRISLVTLGVRDLARAIGFYRDALHWRLPSASSGDVAFFRTGGTILALFPYDELAADANLPADVSGFGGIALWPTTSPVRDWSMPCWPRCRRPARRS